MNALLLAVILAQTAQPQVPFHYMAPFYPERNPTDTALRVTLKDGGGVYYGYLVRDETASGKPLQIRAYFLEDGGGRLEPFPRGNLVPVPRDKIESFIDESESAQHKLVERYLKQAGLSQVTNSSGQTWWIPKGEADLIAKANQMAQANAPSGENPLVQLLADGSTVEPGLENASVSGSGGEPGFLGLWGPQMVIAVAAVALLAAIGYVTFLRG